MNREAARRTRPYAGAHGLVLLTYTAFDDEVGEEIERIEAVPCRRCAASAEERVH